MTRASPLPVNAAVDWERWHRPSVTMGPNRWPRCRWTCCWRPLPSPPPENRPRRRFLRPLPRARRNRSPAVPAVDYIQAQPVEVNCYYCYYCYCYYRCCYCSHYCSRAMWIGLWSCWLKRSRTPCPRLAPKAHSFHRLLVVPLRDPATDRLSTFLPSNIEAFWEDVGFLCVRSVKLMGFLVTSDVCWDRMNRKDA